MIIANSSRINRQIKKALYVDPVTVKPRRLLTALSLGHGFYSDFPSYLYPKGVFSAGFFLVSV